jgi:hypothetical protein
MAKRTKTPDRLTVDEVAEALRARGVKPPSRFQLYRWDSLLPRAGSLHTGRRGRPKNQYQPEAVDRLEVLMAVRGGQRMRLRTLRFELWRCGIDSELPNARDYMIRRIEQRFDGFGTTRSRSTDPLDVADEAINDLRSSRIYNPLLRLVLHRVGGDLDGFCMGAHSLIVCLLGGEDASWEDDQAGAPDELDLSPGRAIVKMTGFERAATDMLPDGTRLMDEEPDVRDLLTQLRRAGGVDFRRPSTTLAEATPEELTQARVDASVFAEVLPLAARVAQHAYGRDFAGLGIFTVLHRLSNRYFFVLLTLWLLVVRRALGGEGIDMINQVLRAEWSRFKAYLSVIDAFPQYARYLKADQETQLANCSDAFRARMRTEINAFLEQHPEIEQALTS